MSTIADAKAAVLQPLEGFKPIAILTALGIVYGDIGTSPLYVFQAIAKTKGGHFDARERARQPVADLLDADHRRHDEICLVVMRADNRGEGGILALMSLTRRELARPQRAISSRAA